MSLYEIDDDGGLSDAAPPAGLNHTAGGRSVLAMSLVSNNMDLFVGNEAGPNFMFVNNGDGTYAEMAEDLGLADPTEHARGVAALDTNGNGLFDVVIGNWEGPNRMFLQDDRGRFADGAGPALSRQSRVRSVLAADFDNDGREELFFNNIGQANRLFLNWDGMWEEADPGDAAEPTGLGTGAVVGDFDEDGQLEMLIVHGETGFQPLTLYKARLESSDWLRILPLTKFGAPARGTTVSAVMPDRVQRRTIDAGSGYLCQMEPVAHFGLGDRPEVERVIVRWPDGATKIIEDPEINRVHRIEHPISEKPGLISGQE